jgi:thiol:disulfide interchange protein
MKHALLNTWSTSLLAILVLAAITPAAGAPVPVTWSTQLEPADIRAGEGGRIVLSARIDPPWHMYSTTMREGGPVVTRIELVAGKALTAAGKLAQPEPKRAHDPNFDMDVEEFEGAVAFGIPVKVAAGASGEQKAVVRVRYQVCTDKQCLQAKTVEVPVSFKISPGPSRAGREKPDTSVPPQPLGAAGGGTVQPGSPGGPSKSGPSPAVAGEFAQRVRDAQSAGFLAFLWLSLSMGFLALLTPCVFPMVPITVSFFSKHQGTSRREGVAGALAYCAGIIATFTALGLALTVWLGATGILNFAANPYVNLGLAALFIVLAINLFGVFEIQVPAALVNRLQGGRGRGRFVGPLLMGLTFTVTSFTCTVPFVGTLLVSATQGQYFWPVVGMLAFSAAFASPFFLLALFPQWLARMPKSGPWLVSVKAYMGFLELAAALKFLSNADYVWHMGLLTRPVFLAVWAGVAVVAGLYLVGWLCLPHDAGTLRIGGVRRILGLATAGAGICFLGAIGGRTLGGLDAFLPPPGYGAPRLMATRWLSNYNEALALARQERKPIFVNFTGYT